MEVHCLRAAIGSQLQGLALKNLHLHTHHPEGVRHGIAEGAQATAPAEVAPERVFVDAVARLGEVASLDAGAEAGGGVGMGATG